ncbi:signal peptidase II, partial [Erysipelotrichaceae bacterium OttesenSCG-928-M19]|nr:signal peptidase II [Erysipelotrichaceae bacterium OttesenSCG-928-M19]
MKKKQIAIIVFILVTIDQLSKYLISTNMKLYQEIPIIDNFFSLLYIRNSGAAFSMLEGKTWFFYLITIIALVIVYYLYKASKNKLNIIACTILLAGILGNFIDRLIHQ